MSLYERFPHNRIPGFRLYPDESLRPPEAASPGGRLTDADPGRATACHLGAVVERLDVLHPWSAF